MNSEQATETASKTVRTTKGTIATYNRADMRRVFQYIDADDLAALDTFMLVGRAFHLPEGVEVFVLGTTETKKTSMCELRIKGSIAEIWASHTAITKS